MVIPSRCNFLLCEVDEVEDFPDCDFSVDIYSENYEFVRNKDTGVLMLRAFNQCGYDCTNTDVVKFLEYCALHMPELYMKNVTTDLMRKYT